jgi:PAS domain S-box-containing protein
MAAAIDEVFWLCTPDLQQLLYVSPAFERVWGRPCAEALTCCGLLTESLHPDDRARFLAAGAEGAKARWELQNRILRPDGALRWVRHSLRRVAGADGRTAMVVGVTADITETKLYQKALIESFARLVTVLDSIDADIYVADAATREIVFANRHLKETFGGPLLGRPSTEVFSLPEAPGASGTGRGAAGAEAPSQSAGPRVWESRNPRTGRWYIHYERPIPWVDGRAVHLLIATDITRLKELEIESRSIQARLQQTQKMEAIGTLAGGIAHDFNNVLSAVMGYGEIALMETDDAAPVRRHLGEILKAAGRARDLVKQILTFSRQTEQEFKPVQLHLLVKEAANFMRASLPATIAIRLNPQSQAVTLADPTQIHQVIINLCTNAAHAMRESGGVLTLAVEDVVPEEAFFAEHPELVPGPCQRLSVMDTGGGIAADVLPRIFEPFFTTKACGEGTGMGLAVVQGIVNSHRGFIGVESVPGGGTRFDVLLPIIPGEIAPDAFGVLPRLPPGSERILFIDDERTLAELGKRILERLGYRVSAHDDPAEALAAFKRSPELFDLVLTDMTMPRITGDVLAREILCLRPGIPVILCTGFNERISRERAAALGVREFLLKPMGVHELAHTVRKVLDGGAG